MGKCILCDGNATINKQVNASRTIYNCQKCGVFVISDLVVDEVKRKGSELAAFFVNRKLARHNEIVLISFDKAARDKDYVQLTVDQILAQFPTSFSAQTDLVLSNLAMMSDYAGEEIKVDGLDMCPVFCVRKRAFDALSFVIKSLQKFELLEVNYYGSSFFPCGVIISPSGWDHIAKIQSGKANEDTALLCMPGPMDEFYTLFRKVAHKAARECGFQVTELNTAGDGGKVDFEMIAQVKRSRFVICAMTHASGGAYYTAGMAQALGKPVILTCHKASVRKLDIDTEQISVLVWNEEQELYLNILNAIRALVQ